MTDSNEELVAKLRGVDHMSVEDCFLQSPLFEKAATCIESLTRELAEAKVDDADVFAVAHTLQWASELSPADRMEAASMIRTLAGNCRVANTDIRDTYKPKIDTLTRELAEARAAKKPDYCYDPKEWDCTHAWVDRSELTMELPLGGILEVVTLTEGPSKWAAHVPITWDDSGDPDDTEVKWFDCEEAAKAAFLPTPPTSTTEG